MLPAYSCRLMLAALLVSSAAGGVVWPNEVERVERDLAATADVEVRRVAARRLGDLPRSVAVRLVRLAADDPDAAVRVSVAEAALDAQMRDVGVLVVPWLSDPDAAVREAAARVLLASPHPDAVAPLGRLLSDPSPTARLIAARALGSSGDPAATLLLLGHMDDSSSDVRGAVVMALERLHDPRAVVPLIGKVQDARPAVRLHAVRALGMLGDPRAEAALVLALRDAEADVRVSAMSALGQLQASNSVLAIQGVLQADKSPLVQAAGVRALAQIGSPRAIEELSHLMAGTQAQLARLAQDAMITLGVAAIPSLERCATRGSASDVLSRCVTALGRLRAAGSRGLIEQALRTQLVSEEVALRALGELGDAAALPTILEYLESPSALTRKSALDAAALLLDPAKPDGRVVEPIRRALQRAGVSTFERFALLALLGRTGARSAGEILALYASADNERVSRVAALEALAELGPSGQSQVLFVALEDASPAVRRAGALGLRRAGDAEILPALLDRLESAPAAARAGLVWALRGPAQRSQDAAQLERLVRLLRESRGAERDALLEVLAVIRLPAARAHLGGFARHGAAEVRRKVAEVLASRQDAAALAADLAKDRDGSVRANAVWSLGDVGDLESRPVLLRAAKDPDVAVVGNAVASLARLAARAGQSAASAAPVLCSALSHSHPYVRANALAGLRVFEERCEGRVRWLLENDSSPVVRAASARLLKHAPDQQDRVMLGQCAASDVNGEVAVQCGAAPEPAARREARHVAVTVLVVPEGSSTPTGSVPFALVRADGFLRLGLTDAGGAVLEAHAPLGELTLAEPAPLVR